MTNPVHARVDAPRRSRLDGVDVLRGLCVLLVLVHHIHLRFALNDYDVDEVLPGPLNRALFWSGYDAVIAFFVISGFLITSLSLKRWGALRELDVRRFYVLRLARIAPCLLLLLALLSVLHLAGATDFQIRPERATLGRALLAALTFHVNWLEGHHGYLPGGWDVLWSLSVEEVFYLLFPLLCVLIRSERLLLWPLIGLIVIGPINRVVLADQDPWQETAYLSCMDGIAFGALAALIVVRQRLARRTLQLLLTLGAAAALLVVVLRDGAITQTLSRYGLDISVLELGVAMVLVALGNDVGNGAMSRGTGWLRTIGRASYEVYLFHMLVILALMNLFRRWHPALETIPAWYLAMLLLSLLLGYLISKTYSEPLNRWLRAAPASARARAGTQAR